VACSAGERKAKARWKNGELVKEGAGAAVLEAGARGGSFGPPPSERRRRRTATQRPSSGPVGRAHTGTDEAVLDRAGFASRPGREAVAHFQKEFISHFIFKLKQY
jgi:hypothetical protein